MATHFGASVAVIPHHDLFKSIIARQGARDGSGTEDPGAKPVPLLLSGWRETFYLLPAALVAIPYGIAADRVGRKPILLLSFVGILLEGIATRLICWGYAFIPLGAVWAAPVFQIFGGGFVITKAMAYTMITDVFPSDKRISIFCVMAAAILLAEFVAIPLSMVLTYVKGPWVLSLLGFLCQVVGLITATALPETHPKLASIGEQDNKRQNTSDTPNLEPTGDSNFSNWMAICKAELETIREQNPFNARMAFNASAFLLASIAEYAASFIVQYTQVAFWDLNLVIAMVLQRDGIALVTLLVLLPTLCYILNKSMSPATRDLRITQGSTCIFALGIIIMAFADRVLIFVVGEYTLPFGAGFFSALRSLAIALALPSRTGLTNTVVCVAQTVGIMMIQPARGYFSQVGSRLENLLYVNAAVVFLGAIYVNWAIRAPREDIDSVRDAS
ncbi:hypothetical protein FQN49_008129 [Arthroderma sp. PD_2]|nr:hypothetical protein FQN49_008129 [Arthroderma sp. PD_2]